MDLNVLWVFDAIHATRSLARAAARLGLTQPGLSRALARLRAEFGDPLFVKVRGELVLTPRGSVVATAIRDALAHLETAFSETEKFAPATAARGFTLRVTSSFAAALLVPLQLRLEVEAPAVSLEVAPALADYFDALELGTADVSIASRPPARPGLLGRTLLRDSLVCLLRCSDSADWPDGLGLEEFVSRKHVGVAFHSEAGSVVDEILSKRNLQRRVNVQVQDVAAAAELVASSNMVAIVPSLTAERLAQVYPVISLAPPFDLGSFELFMSWHERMQTDAAHAWLRQVIAEVAEHHAVSSRRRGFASG